MGLESAKPFSELLLIPSSFISPAIADKTFKALTPDAVDKFSTSAAKVSVAAL